MKPRIRNWSELSGAAFFFREDYPVDAAAVEKLTAAPEARERLAAVRAACAALPAFDAPALETVLVGLAEARGLKHVDIKQPVRAALTGSAGGPDLAQLMALLGRARVLARLDRQLG
jgi:glutamyl-tRNA synthetase